MIGKTYPIQSPAQHPKVSWWLDHPTRESFCQAQRLAQARMSGEDISIMKLGRPKALKPVNMGI